MSKEHLQGYIPKYLENRFLKDIINNNTTVTIVLTHALSKQLRKSSRCPHLPQLLITSPLQGTCFGIHVCTCPLQLRAEPTLLWGWGG